MYQIVNLFFFFVRKEYSQEEQWCVCVCVGVGREDLKHCL